MATCADCHDEEGRPRDAPISVTRWTAMGTETTLRCPHCGWQVTRPDPTTSVITPAGPPAGDQRSPAA
jgi:hypothetical protein